ncbi:NAD(P)-dependent oxidoreductase [Homoserinibacter sp. GY 40078]|uniref:NAD-dependent epimerase/dehydratase family protein n=1 Tax=Homoserinibacter sp. GY 40078 TaxID=2603275 RepID=UPI0011C8D211|nr:NAD(P)-dependent oxidoreductase [Homoserinibacter sp. GY 40078]TXK19428.1 NAD(P)-dependent oxidoreductase [Homoserinibacter sp. GY 40078]
MRIAITGSSGKLGRATVDRLVADGHEVLGFDLTGTPGPGFTRVDLLDYGQTLDALLGVTARHTGLDALVHLAAIPVNGLVPDVTTFHNNLTATFNVLFAARRAGIRTIVTASSITAMGFPFDDAPPYLPVDEGYTASYNTYGLGKVLEETMATELVRWDPELSLTALRFTNVVGVGEYGTFERASDPAYRRDLLGSYIDARDGAQLVALALAHARPGFETYVAAAPDSGVDIPSPELAERWFPGIEIRGDLGARDSLLSTTKAHDVLGFRAAYDWRTELRAERG